MSIRIQIRRGVSSEWSDVNPVLAEGELALESDTSLYKIGDGVTHWNSLPYNRIQDANGVVTLSIPLTSSTLPNPPEAGQVARVTDADSPLLGSPLTGGGSSNALVWYNGTSWNVFAV